jgi:uncharacterized membrane-anchored protein YjiN (DUF445 family)
MRAFFDGSLAGALADWFAVTALFRKPAGLPLPHTDLVVKKKDELAEAVPRFLGGFLQPQALAPILEGLDYASALEARLGPKALQQVLDRPEVERWASQALGAIAGLLHDDLQRRQSSLVDPMTGLIKRRAGWKGLFVGRDTVEELFQGLLAELNEFRKDPEHALRPLLLQAVREGLGHWSDNPPWGPTDESRAAFNRQAATLALQVWQSTQAAERLGASLTFVLKQADARELSERLREAVAGDLQAIRVNGAVVGGVAGVLLQTLSALILGQ